MSKINIKTCRFLPFCKKYCPNKQKSVQISGSQDILILYKQNLDWTCYLSQETETPHKFKPNFFLIRKRVFLPTRLLFKTTKLIFLDSYHNPPKIFTPRKEKLTNILKYRQVAPLYDLLDFLFYNIYFLKLQFKVWGGEL